MNKSTVPIGTAQMATEALNRYELNTTIVSMPEFLAEGQAVQNLVKPDRIVIGVKDDDLGEAAFQALKKLHQRQEESGT